MKKASPSSPSIVSGAPSSNSISWARPAIASTARSVIPWNSGTRFRSVAAAVMSPSVRCNGRTIRVACKRIVNAAAEREPGRCGACRRGSGPRPGPAAGAGRAGEVNVGARMPAGTGHHDRRRSMSTPGVSPGACAGCGGVSPGEAGGGVRRASRAPADAVASHSAGTPTGAPAGGDQRRLPPPAINRTTGPYRGRWPRWQTVANQVEPRRQRPSLRELEPAGSQRRRRPGSGPGAPRRPGSRGRGLASTSRGQAATGWPSADRELASGQPRRPRRRRRAPSGRAFLVAPEQVRQRGGEHLGLAALPETKGLATGGCGERLGECHGSTMPAAVLPALERMVKDAQDRIRERVDERVRRRHRCPELRLAVGAGACVRRFRSCAGDGAGSSHPVLGGRGGLRTIGQGGSVPPPPDQAERAPAHGSDPGVPGGQRPHDRRAPAIAARTAARTAWRRRRGGRECIASRANEAARAA